MAAADPLLQRRDGMRKPLALLVLSLICAALSVGAWIVFAGCVVLIVISIRGYRATSSAAESGLYVAVAIINALPGPLLVAATVALVTPASYR